MASHTASCEFCKYTSTGENQQVDCAAKGVVRGRLGVAILAQPTLMRGNMSRYLVTGGAGFIGSHLCQRLCEEGHTVRVLDDLSTGRRENLATILGEIEFVEGDIRDAALLAEVMQQVDCVPAPRSHRLGARFGRTAPRRSGSQRRGNAAAFGSGAAGGGAPRGFC